MSARPYFNAAHVVWGRAVSFVELQAWYEPAKLVFRTQFHSRSYIVGSGTPADGLAYKAATP